MNLFEILSSLPQHILLKPEKMFKDKDSSIVLQPVKDDGTSIPNVIPIVEVSTDGIDTQPFMSDTGKTGIEVLKEAVKPKSFTREEMIDRITNRLKDHHLSDMEIQDFWNQYVGCGSPVSYNGKVFIADSSRCS